MPISLTRKMKGHMHDSYGPSLEVVHITSTYNPLINSTTLPPLIVRETFGKYQEGKENDFGNQLTISATVS